jgi:hypothetical protein
MSYLFICNSDFQYEPKATIVLIQCYHILELWTLWKLIHFKFIKECMDVKCGLMVWKTCSVHMKQTFEI